MTLLDAQYFMGNLDGSLPFSSGRWTLCILVAHAVNPHKEGVFSKLLTQIVQVCKPVGVLVEGSFPVSRSLYAHKNARLVQRFLDEL